MSGRSTEPERLAFLRRRGRGTAPALPAAMSIRIFLPVVGVFLSLGAVACSDSGGETLDGDDGSELDCPEQEPATGTACDSTFPDECHYAACPDDPNGGGYRVYECDGDKIVESGSDAMCTPSSSTGVTGAGGGEGGSGGAGEGGSGGAGEGGSGGAG